MGTTAGDRLNVMGYREVSGALGAALAFNVGGELILVNYNLYEFITRTGQPPSPATNPERLAVD